MEKIPGNSIILELLERNEEDILDHKKEVREGKKSFSPRLQDIEPEAYRMLFEKLTETKLKILDAVNKGENKKNIINIFKELTEFGNKLEEKYTGGETSYENDCIRHWGQVLLFKL